MLAYQLGWVLRDLAHSEHLDLLHLLREVVVMHREKVLLDIGWRGTECLLKLWRELMLDWLVSLV